MFFVSLGLKGDCPVGLLERNHVLIHPSVEEDYTRLFARRVWYVWISFPKLALPFFQHSQLVKLALAVGRPLKIDTATCDLRHPSAARLLVELDVGSPLNRRIWIGNEDHGFWQFVKMEQLPSYCSYCGRFGHMETECFRKDPSLQ